MVVDHSGSIELRYSAVVLCCRRKIIFLIGLSLLARKAADSGFKLEGDGYVFYGRNILVSWKDEARRPLVID